MNENIIQAVKVIKTAILESQAQALRDANSSLLSLYYDSAADGCRIQLSNMPFGTLTSQWVLQPIGLPRRCRRGCATPCRQLTS